MEKIRMIELRWKIIYYVQAVYDKIYVQFGGPATKLEQFIRNTHYLNRSFNVDGEAIEFAAAPLMSLEKKNIIEYMRRLLHIGKNVL